MKFEIPFDETIYRHQIEETFKITWEKFRRETRKTAITALLSLFLGSIIIYGKGDIGRLFVFLGVVFIIVALVQYNKYKEARKKTERLTEESIQKWNEKPMSTWEFEDSYFRFEYYGGDYKMYWDNFKYCKVVDQTLFFGFNEKSGWYTISESEIGKEHYDKVVDFVVSKIHPVSR